MQTVWVIEVIFLASLLHRSLLITLATRLFWWGARHSNGNFSRQSSDKKFLVNNQLIKVYFVRSVNSLIKGYSLHRLWLVIWTITSVWTWIERVPWKLLISCTTTVGAESDENKDASSRKQRRRMQFPQINNQFLGKKPFHLFLVQPVSIRRKVLKLSAVFLGPFDIRKVLRLRKK